MIFLRPGKREREREKERRRRRLCRRHPRPSTNSLSAPPPSTKRKKTPFLPIFSALARVHFDTWITFLHERGNEKQHSLLKNAGKEAKVCYGGSFPTVFWAFSASASSRIAPNLRRGIAMMSHQRRVAESGEKSECIDAYFQGNKTPLFQPLFTPPASLFWPLSRAQERQDGRRRRLGPAAGNDRSRQRAEARLRCSFCHRC